MRVFPLIFFIAAIAACNTTPDEVKLPEVVRVPVDRFVPLDPALTAACKQQDAKDQLWETALVLLELRRIWLADCAARMDRIRALQPKVTP